MLKLDLRKRDASGYEATSCSGDQFVARRLDHNKRHRCEIREYLPSPLERGHDQFSRCDQNNLASVFLKDFLLVGFPIPACKFGEG